MEEKRFNIVFSGKIVEGMKPLEILEKLCPVLRLDQPQVRELFKGGAGSVILKELDAKKAYAMQEEIREAGALCTLQEIIPPPSQGNPDAAMLTGEAPQQAYPDQNHPSEAKPVWKPSPTPTRGGSRFFSLFIKFILIGALAGGGWWVYQTYLSPPSPAFEAYLAYSDALAHGQYQTAAEASVGQAHILADSRMQMMSPSGIRVYGKDYSMSKPAISSIAGEISWIKHKRKGQKVNEFNRVNLEVEETVCRIPPGITAVKCNWPVTFLHEVEVSQANGTWKVSSFKEERLTPLEQENPAGGK